MEQRQPQPAISPDEKHRYEFMVKVFHDLGAYAVDTLHAGKAVTFKDKDDGTPVTTLDTEINERFIESVHKHFGEEDIVIGEEESDPDYLSQLEDKGVWIIDPLDGTSRLVDALKAGQLDYSRLRVDMLGAYFLPGQKQPAMSIQHNPFYDNQPSSIITVGGGSYYQASNTAMLTRAHVNQYAPNVLRDVKLFERNGLEGGVQNIELVENYLHPDASRQRLPFFLGSTALGEVDLTLFPGPSYPHDVAAGAHSVHHAGGVVKTFDGESYRDVDWRKFPINGVVAGANEALVNQAIDRVNRFTAKQ